MLLITWSGKIRITGIARKRKVIQYPSHIEMVSCFSQDPSKRNFKEAFVRQTSDSEKVARQFGMSQSDGNFVALGHKDGMVTIWSIGQGMKCVRVYSKHHDFAVLTLYFSDLKRRVKC